MRVLHAIHDFLPRHLAGSEIYCLELCRALQERGTAVHVVCAEYDPAASHGTLRWTAVEGVGVTEVVNNWAFATFAESYDSPFLTHRLDQVLAILQPDVLHVHNLLNLSFALPALARRRGIPVVATLHDYTLVCAAGGQRLHVAEEHVCHVIDTERCARCFAQHPLHAQLVFGQRALAGSGGRRLGALAAAVRRRLPALAAPLARLATRPIGTPLTPADLEARLTAARGVFADVDLFVAPSESLAMAYRSLGMPPEKLRVSDYGMPPLGEAPALVPADAAPTPDDPRRLRVGFVGTIVWHKGVHVLLAAIAALPPERVEVTVFGDLGVAPDYASHLQRQAAGLPVHFAAAFPRAERAAAYAQLDVLVVPSLWPENSPLVIHEAFQAGVPVVGSRLGGTAGLVTHERSGLLYDATSPAALAAALRRLLDEPGLLQRLAAGVPAVKTIDEDAAQWQAVYAAVSGRAPRGDDGSSLAAGRVAGDAAAPAPPSAPAPAGAVPDAVSRGR